MLIIYYSCKPGIDLECSWFSGPSIGYHREVPQKDYKDQLMNCMSINQGPDDTRLIAIIGGLEWIHWNMEKGSQQPFPSIIRPHYGLFPSVWY